MCVMSRIVLSIAEITKKYSDRGLVLNPSFSVDSKIETGVWVINVLLIMFNPSVYF